LQIVAQRRAFEEICEWVRADLEAGRLKSGDRLPGERELSERFGVSRAAVREALRSLGVAGIVQSQRGAQGGPFIQQGDTAVITRAVRDMLVLRNMSMGSLTEARILITNDAIRLACQRATEDDLDALERNLELTEELARSGDRVQRSMRITQFYRLLARAAHNEVLEMLVDSLTEIGALLIARAAPTPRSDLVDDHRRVLAHLRARDEAAAINEMTRHLQRVAIVLADDEQARARKPPRRGAKPAPA
jgi:DNA-binding FadR family transcriptional regulator